MRAYLIARNAVRATSLFYQHHGIKATTTSSTLTLLNSVQQQQQQAPKQNQQLRWYRGDSGDGIPNLSEDEMRLLEIAKPKDIEIRKNHFKLVSIDDIPKESLGVSLGDYSVDDPIAAELDIRRKRLIYRAKQRGWLEVDVLLGTWAHENVPNLLEEELDEFEAFVNMETIDIYNVITLRLDIPDELKNKKMKVVERIQDWARNSPLGKADPEKYKTVKTEANLT